MSLILYALLFVGAIYALLKYVFTYWIRHGFKSLEPTIPFGNLNVGPKNSRQFACTIQALYDASIEPFIGIYIFFTPMLLVRDAELAHKILTSDFGHFVDRGVYCNRKVDPMSGNLFALRGEEWKQLRNKISPSFTSGKLKGMFSTLLDVGRQLDDHLRPLAERNETVDMKETLLNYVLGNIASVFFGLDVNNFTDPDNVFKKISIELNKKDFKSVVRFAGTFLFPKYMERFGISSTTPILREMLLKLVREIIELRESRNISRKDLMQLMIQLRNTGQVTEEDDWSVKNDSSSAGKPNKSHFSVEDIAANAFIFYIAGSETSATTASFCLFELCQYPEVMEKLVREIDETLDKHEGQITYECIMEMKYLDMCVNETIRLVPGTPMLNRECNKDYRIPGTDKVITKGTSIMIAIQGIQNDEKYFEKAHEFIPERFSAPPGSPLFTEIAYTPFGDGPRHCIAIRMGKMMAKMALVLLLSKYKFEPIAKRRLEFEPGSVGVIPKGGAKLTMSSRIDTHVRL